MDIKKLADFIAKKYQTRNPFEILKGMNTILVFAQLVDIRGFYQSFQRNNIIYIDENLQEHEQRLVCAHELGHMLLHKNENTVFMDSRTHLKTSTYETEANKFAVELLIPNEVILENWKCTTEQLSFLTGYPEELIKLRLQ